MVPAWRPGSRGRCRTQVRGGPSAPSRPVRAQPSVRVAGPTPGPPRPRPREDSAPAGKVQGRPRPDFLPRLTAWNPPGGRGPHVCSPMRARPRTEPAARPPGPTFSRGVRPARSARPVLRGSRSACPELAWPPGLGRGGGGGGSSSSRAGGGDSAARGRLPAGNDPRGTASLALRSRSAGRRRGSRPPEAHSSRAASAAPAVGGGGGQGAEGDGGGRGRGTAARAVRGAGATGQRSGPAGPRAPPQPRRRLLPLQPRERGRILPGPAHLNILLGLP